jgi:hypothetical protein
VKFLKFNSYKNSSIFAARKLLSINVSEPSPVIDNKYTKITFQFENEKTSVFTIESARTIEEINRCVELIVKYLGETHLSVIDVNWIFLNYRASELPQEND